MNTHVQIQADDLLNDLHEQLSAANGRAAYVSAENKALVRAIETLEEENARLRAGGEAPNVIVEGDSG